MRTRCDVTVLHGGLESRKYRKYIRWENKAHFIMFSILSYIFILLSILCLSTRCDAAVVCS